jgi:hypothetical protein
MRIYIANFGKGNWAWEVCLKRQALAVMDDERVHPYWIRRDREGYIEQAQKVLRLASGGPVTKSVASRWFNLNNILVETNGDLWIHREKKELWWTNSIEAVPEIEHIDDPRPHRGTARIYVYYKRCSGWSNRNKKGVVLGWEGLHPRAKEFLFTEGTFQQLSNDHAAYAESLIHGHDLSPWHDRPDWRNKADRSKRGPVTIFDARKKTIARMAMTAMETVAQSGSQSIAVTKDKEFRFRDQLDMEKHLDELLAGQDGLCALTGLRMLFDSDDGDPELRCSLDRIDSSGNYELGNLQIVCKFANRWKGSSDNDAFISLIETVRSLG